MSDKTEEYYLSLLSKYKDGTISTSDRFELEKKALDDPFLFDALEGFSTSEDENDNIVPIGKKRNSSWKYIVAAASVLVFIGALGLINVNKSADSQYSANDASLSDGPTQIADNLPNIGKEENESLPTTKSREAISTVTSKKDSKEEVKTPTNTTTQNQDERFVAEDNDAPTTVEKVKQEEVTSNPEGQIASNNSTQFDEMESEDIATTSTENIKVLADRGADLESKSKSSAKAKSSAVNYYRADPMIGKSIFEEYAKEKIDSRGLRKTPSIIVTIEFELDENNMPTRFTYINEDCPKCGAFAISLLTESGEWKTNTYSENGRLRYDFEF